MNYSEIRRAVQNCSKPSATVGRAFYKACGLSFEYVDVKPKKQKHKRDDSYRRERYYKRMMQGRIGALDRQR